MWLIKHDTVINNTIKVLCFMCYCKGHIRVVGSFINSVSSTRQLNIKLRLDIIELIGLLNVIELTLYVIGLITLN